MFGRPLRASDASGASATALNRPTNVSSVHEPMPVSPSGVMLAEYWTCPSRVLNSKPPAKAIPSIGRPRVIFVWQVAQLPIVAR